VLDGRSVLKDSWCSIIKNLAAIGLNTIPIPKMKEMCTIRFGYEIAWQMIVNDQVHIYSHNSHNMISKKKDNKAGNRTDFLVHRYNLLHAIQRNSRCAGAGSLVFVTSSNDALAIFAGKSAMFGEFGVFGESGELGSPCCKLW